MNTILKLFRSAFLFLAIFFLVVGFLSMMIGFNIFHFGVALITAIYNISGSEAPSGQGWLGLIVFYLAMILSYGLSIVFFITTFILIDWPQKKLKEKPIPYMFLYLLSLVIIVYILFFLFSISLNFFR